MLILVILRNLGLYCERYVCSVCLHRSLNHIIYAIVQMLHSFQGIYNPSTPRAVLTAFVCDGKVSFIVEVRILL